MDDLFRKAAYHLAFSLCINSLSYFLGHRNLIKNTNTNSGDKNCSTMRFYAKFDVSVLGTLQL